MQSSNLINRFRNGFEFGYTSITTEKETDGVGFDFGIYQQANAEVIAECHAKETIWVLMNGSASVVIDGAETKVERNSLFDEAPTAVHLGPECAVKIKALSPTVEWALMRVKNNKSIPAKIYFPKDIVPEYRGKGLVQDACLRNVRLIFDNNTNKDSNFVLGEVINYPGRWSSYPPHHHEQPEIYHYRFSETQGYGHAEVGEDVTIVKQFDTLKIPVGKTHAQTSAPGYGMYYLWVIRHLDANRYEGFEFTQEHKWTLDANKQGWQAGLEQQ